MEQIKKEEVSICLEILNEIAMNGVNLRQAELLVVLRNTLTQGPIGRTGRPHQRRWGRRT